MENLFKKTSEKVELKLEELREIFLNDDRLYRGLADIKNLIKKFDEIFDRWYPPPSDQELLQARRALLDRDEPSPMGERNLTCLLIDALSDVRDPREGLRLLKKVSRILNSGDLPLWDVENPNI